jgi:hypothetical protein
MKNSYYSPNDYPNAGEKDEIWARIEHNLPKSQQRSAVIIHWRSFIFGNVAALLILFSGIGIWFIINSPILDRTARVDMAYENAMNTIVNVSPDLLDSAPDERKAMLESTIMNIEDIDRVINEIRDDMLINGTSEIKQRQLRQMYAMKMDNLKDLLLAGEVEL